MKNGKSVTFRKFSGTSNIEELKGKVAKRITNLRKLNGETQGDLATALSVTRSAVKSYEAGAVFPSVEVLVNMAMHYNVTSDYILNLSSNNDSHLFQDVQTIDEAFYVLDEVLSSADCTYHGFRLTKSGLSTARSLFTNFIRLVEEIILDNPHTNFYRQ